MEQVSRPSIDYSRKWILETSDFLRKIRLAARVDTVDDRANENVKSESDELKKSPFQTTTLKKKIRKSQIFSIFRYDSDMLPQIASYFQLQ
jgi:hypothetical protein